MPIHEFGYRPWDGQRLPRWTRFWPIMRTGIGLAKQPVFVRRLCFLAVVPLIYLGVVFYAIGVLTDPDNTETSNFVRSIVSGTFGDIMAARLRSDPAAVRAEIWNDLFLAFHTYSLPAVGLISLAVAPKLISNDLRTKAFLIYFSRPIGRVDYLVGKAGVLAAYLAWFTLLPSIGVYVLSIVFAPSIDTLFQTWSTLPSIFAASLCTIVPLTALGLFVSSCTKFERVATFSLIAIVLGGQFGYLTISNLPSFENATWPVFLSLRETAANAIGYSFSEPTVLDQFIETPASGASVAFLAGLTAFSTIGLWRRISAPMSI